MTCLWHNDEFVMWQTIDVMTCVALIDVIMIILTPGTFWQHDAFCWHPNTLFDLMTNIFTTFSSFWLYFSLFREQNIIKTCFWCHNELFWCHGMFFMSWRHRVFLTLWQTFWHHDELFELLTYFWRYDVLLMSSHVFDVMTNFLTTWRKFWRYEVLMLWRTFWGYDVISISWQHRHSTQPNTYKYIRMMMWSDFVE